MGVIMSKLAVIKTGGKQYLASESDTIEVEKLPGEAGDKIKLKEVLLIASDDGLNLGQPLVKKARVEAEIVKQFKGKKVRGMKKSASTSAHYRKWGHRQKLTQIKITEIFEI